MLSSREISQPGFYWYYPAHGAPPVLVEVHGDDAEGLVARFSAKPDEQPVHALSGSFHGPIPRPLS
jgi:hypothetical protein